jgi:Bacterial Ig-like domain (group 2)
MKTVTRIFIGMLCGILMLGFLAGCGGGSSGGPAVLASIEVTPTKSTIALGTTAQFTATGVFSDHTKKDLTSSVTWSPSNGNASISNTAGSSGLARAVAAGTTTITATMGGISGNTILTVSAATLQTIGVTSTNPSIALGTTRQFVATGTFSDNTTQNLTSQVTWSSSNGNASISNTAGSNGLATAVTTGSAVITATFGAITGSTTLSVTAATLQTIEVTPANPSITGGTFQQFTATGIFSDSSKQDLTGSVTWSSSNHAAATINSGGLATGAGVGTSTITATLGLKSGTTTLTVTAASLVAIEVAPLSPSIALGTGQQFSAIGRFADNTTQDLTTAVTWTSSAAGVATVSNATGSNGLSTSVGAGSTTITAEFGGVSGSTLLTVKDTTVTLTSIDVEPSVPSVPAGVKQPFTATGSYSDGSTQDLTTAVTWSSNALAVATISDAADSKGTALAIAPGTATITAALGAVSGSTQLTVTAATLTSIEVNPPALSIPKGLNQQFMATGIFSDNSVFDLTSVATWSTSAPGVAIVSNGAGSAGLARTVGAGNATITATFTLSGITVSGSSSLTVTSATLASIAVIPASPSIAVGTTQLFAATGTYSDNSNWDITQFVTWTSTVPSVASISNTVGQKGVATGVKAGTTGIRAAMGTIVSADDMLTVTNATLQSITIEPPVSPATDVTIATKTNQQFTATGHFDNTTTQDLTRLVTWKSSNSTIAAISNASSSKGVATGVTAGGPVTITATFSGISGTASLTVVTATLTSLAILPANFTIANGTSQQFQAIGTYNNGLFTQDLTKAVKWSTTNKSIAVVSNGFNTRGLTTGESAGSTTISATKPATVIIGSTGITVQ